MQENTRKRYSKTWLDFVQLQGITADNPPTQDDFMDFFVQKKNGGHGYNTLKSEYSHINKVLKCAYGYDLSKYPRIWEFINSQGNGKIFLQYNYFFIYVVPAGEGRWHRGRSLAPGKVVGTGEGHWHRGRSLVGKTDMF